MSMDKLIIPQKINVGFQERHGTYTGKLAYIVYTDAKGVLRKAGSWNSWRNKSIEPEEYANEPTSGFVLNKNVGGGRGWDARQAAVRIFDPRGFEFEISVPNLLFILEECTSTKGKGLEGEFVYSWAGTELVLLPVSSQDYKNSAAFTGLQTKKIEKGDIKEGRIYINKDNDRVMYLGRHDWTDNDTDYEAYGSNTSAKTVKTRKKHIFLYIGNEYHKYWLQDGFTKLASMESEDVNPLYAEAYDTLLQDEHYGNSFSVEREEYSLEKYLNNRWGDNYSSFSCYIDDSGRNIYPEGKFDDANGIVEVYDSGRSITIDGNKVIISSRSSFYYGYNWREKSLLRKITLNELKSMNGIKYHFKNNLNGSILYTIE